MSDLKPEEIFAHFRQAAIDKSLQDMLDLYVEDAIHVMSFLLRG